MARETRSPKPRGMIAPLSQAALGALRGLHEGDLIALPAEHKPRLLDLALIEESADGSVWVTPLGRQRLISDR